MNQLNLFFLKEDEEISPYLLYELVTEIQYNANEKLMEFVEYASKVSNYYLRKKLSENDLIKYQKIIDNIRFINNLVIYVLKNKIETEKKLQALKFQVIEKLQEIEQLYKEIASKLD